MKPLAVPLALALAVTPLLAQEAQPKKKAVPATPILIRGPAAPQDRTPAPPGSYEELDRACKAAEREWMTGYSEAAGEGKEAAQKYLTSTERPTRTFIARFAKRALQHAGTEESVPYLLWLARNDYPNSAAHAKTLLDGHIASPAIGPIVGVLGRGRDLEASLAGLDRIVENSPHENVRMQATYSRGKLRLARGEGDEAAALARQDLLTVIEHGDERTSARAKGDLFQLDNLRIGLTAPDIEGEDLDGVPFKLSDYRGKVVVIDFWGDW